MSELSQHAKLIKAIEIAKGAQVGIELSYFDVLEVAGELNEAKEVVAMLTARIAELEHDLTNKEIEYTDLWNDALAFQSRIAELEAEIERLTVHSDIERQDDKSSNDTQTSTIVYGKEREE